MFFSRALLLQYDKFQIKFIGPQLRRLGQRLYKYGASIQGDLFHEERRNYSYLLSSCSIFEMCSDLENSFPQNSPK